MSPPDLEPKAVPEGRASCAQTPGRLETSARAQLCAGPRCRPDTGLGPHGPAARVGDNEDWVEYNI